MDKNESRVTKQLYEALMENRESLSGGEVHKPIKRFRKAALRSQSSQR